MSEREVITVKVGTDCVRSRENVYALAKRLAVLHRTHDLAVVSSGAVATGERRLHAKRRAADDIDKRDQAFLGTAGSTKEWEEGFERHGILAGQVLMTHHEMVDAREGPRFKAAMARVFRHRFVPILNYKDFLSVGSDLHDEIEKIDVFQDNDVFSREVAQILGAQALILATHGVDGFMDSSGEVVRQFEVSRLASLKAEDYRPSKRGTGGIVSKLTEAVAAVSGDPGMRAFVCGDDARFEQILTGQQICTEVIQ